MKPIWLALAAIGLAQAVAARELVVAHVGAVHRPNLAGNGVGNHEGTRACVEEANATVLPLSISTARIPERGLIGPLV